MAQNDYKATLALPKTAFPMKANLPTREPQTLARWEELGLYQLLLEARAGAQKWVLHDGPPYANGRVHFGTALNKILKDFIVRSRSVLGYRTPFVPGWDCHGMPIELQVVQELGEKARSMSKLELRRLCRERAEHWIDVQRREFRRLGVLADWVNPYVTFSPDYDATEVAVLRTLVEEGYVYRGLRPVHWCSQCRTALAEAEVEYREHTSPSIYVAFALNDKVRDPSALAASPARGPELAEAHRKGKLFALIWTTTPWTLPANLGICLNRGFDYVALKLGDAWFIVAARLAGQVQAACGFKASDQIDLSRGALGKLDGQDIFRHPLVARDSKLMFGDHVTPESGTGLVHTAPGHGYEDFVAGSSYGMPTLTPVDDTGTFTSEAGRYAGLHVFAADEVIVEDLRKSGALLHHDQITHSYPHCWRCKTPLVLRATEQWFLRIDHKGLRQRALEQIDQVEWVPRWSRERIHNMVEHRPDWCLSRQRVWGVPIPALRCSGCGTVSLDPQVMKRVEAIFATEGSDAWYSRDLRDFVPEDYRCSGCGRNVFTKEEDVLDVWFDSGCSHAAVLAKRPDLGWPADAYVEGIDQARGWFQSSLITAAAVRDAAPYRTVVSHGLALDELGRKMSKSLGNFEHAAEVVDRIGADVFRLVFASLDFSADMSVSETLFGSIAEAYRKLRNTCRYLLGNLYDFAPGRDEVPPAEMLDFDRFIMARTEQLKSQVRSAYERYDFQAVYQAILNFAVTDLSALYIDVVRDRLYCSARSSRERRSAQTALYSILDTLVRAVAPLLPFTAEEIYSYFPGEKVQSVHLLKLKPPEPQWLGAEVEARWHRLLALRAETLKVLETMRQSGIIGAPLEAVVKLGADDGSGDELKLITENNGAGLKELFIVSDVQFLGQEEVARFKRLAGDGETFAVDEKFGRIGRTPPAVIVGERAPGRKCQRCWCYYTGDQSPDLCPRCFSVLQAQKA